jgi:hypothetical protein
LAQGGQAQSELLAVLYCVSRLDAIRVVHNWRVVADRQAVLSAQFEKSESARETYCGGVGVLRFGDQYELIE